MAEVRDCASCGEPIRMVDTSCWSCGAAAKKARPSRPAKVRRARPTVEAAGIPAVLGMAGGAALVLGSFLPWVVVSGTSFSAKGTDVSDGWVTVIVGVVAAFAAYQDRRKATLGLRTGLFVLGGMSALVVAYQFRDMGNGLGPGFGLLLTGAGSLAVLAGGLVAHRQLR